MWKNIVNSTNSYNPNLLHAYNLIGNILHRPMFKNHVMGAESKINWKTKAVNECPEESIKSWSILMVRTWRTNIGLP